MARPTLAELKAFFRLYSGDDGGEYGEILAERFLITLDIRYACVTQSPETLGHGLKSYGGKRPDFFGQLDQDPNHILILDAKFHSSEGLKSFALTDVELSRYRKLIQFMSSHLHSFEFDFFFMLMPKEIKGAKLVWIPMEAFDQSELCLVSGEPGRKISLLNREDDWMRRQNLAQVPQPMHLQSDLLRACCDLVTRKG